MRLHAKWLPLLLAGSLACQDPAAPTVTEPKPDPAELAAKLGDDPHAAAALLRLGAEAIPPLLPYLSDQRQWPPASRKAAWDAALKLLEDLGPDAAGAVDALVDALDRDANQTIRPAALGAIGAIAPWLPRRTTIAATLGDRCDRSHYFGAPGFFAAISRLSFDPTQELSSLVSALSHANGYVREFAAEAIARKLAQERPAARAAQALAKQLREALVADVPTQFNLSWTWNGSTANTGGSFSGADDVRSAIALALAAMEPAAVETVPGHVRLLAHTDPVVRINALRALGGFGEAAAPAALAMAKALRDRDAGVAHEAATMLGLLGAAAQPVKSDLIEASKSTDKQLAARAQASLRRIP